MEVTKANWQYERDLPYNVGFNANGSLYVTRNDDYWNNDDPDWGWEVQFADQMVSVGSAPGSTMTTVNAAIFFTFGVLDSHGNISEKDRNQTRFYSLTAYISKDGLDVSYSLEYYRVLIAEDLDSDELKKQEEESGHFTEENGLIVNRSQDGSMNIQAPLQDGRKIKLFHPSANSFLKVLDNATEHNTWEKTTYDYKINENRRSADAKFIDFVSELIPHGGIVKMLGESLGINFSLYNSSNNIPMLHERWREHYHNHINFQSARYWREKRFHNIINLFTKNFKNEVKKRKYCNANMDTSTSLV
jgi:hypothetical protein